MRIAVSVMGRLNRAIGYVGQAALVILMLFNVADVARRYLFNRPVPGTTEIVVYGIAIVIFLSLAYTEEVGSHIKLTFFVSHLPQRVQRVADISALALGACLLGLIAWLTGTVALESLRIREIYPAAIIFPAYPAKIAVSVGCALFSLQLLLNMVKKLLPAIQYEAKQ